MARAASEQASLHWQRPDGKVLEIAVWPERVVTIGRESTNTLVLDSAFVSKQHAIVSWSEGAFRLRDNQSANGTRLNGSPVDESTLQDGDTIEIGDQQIAFVLAADATAAEASARAATGGRAAARTGGSAGAGASGGGNKGLKLAVAAILTMGLMIGGLFGLLKMMTAAAPGAGRPVATRPTAGRPAAAGTGTGAATSGTLAFDQRRSDEAELRAKRAGTNPVDAMFDEAQVYVRSGRWLEAAQLLTGVLKRDPGHERAKINLPRVLEGRDQAIQEHRGEAERAEFQLRYDAAARHWEQVVLLTEPAEAAHGEASRALDAIRKRAAPGR